MKKIKLKIKASPNPNNSNEKAPGTSFRDDRLFGMQVITLTKNSETYIEDEAFTKVVDSNNLESTTLSFADGESVVILYCHP